MKNTNDYNTHLTLTCVATVVGGQDQKFRTRVLDDVLPVDGVSVTQELILIHIHTSIQDFYNRGGDLKRGYIRYHERFWIIDNIWAISPISQYKSY